MKRPTRDRLQRVLESPKLVLREVNRLYYSQKYGEHYDKGVDFFEKDWDNLLILDACRFDTFKRLSDLPGNLTKTYSMASSTREWLTSNCDGHTFHDTVYVTGNPQLYDNKDGNDIEFHDTWDVWLDDGWDDETNTVLPETMAEKAREAMEHYPHKRIIVHFMQPHYPFVGEFGRDYFANEGRKQFYEDVFEGKQQVSMQAVRQAYEENLEHTLPIIDGLLHDLDGKTVVTADHGEAFGERSKPIPIQEFGHPKGIYMEELVAVPWLEYSNNSRRKVTEEVPSPGPETEASSGVVEERLAHLGYKE